jgi:hypothetical protein
MPASRSGRPAFSCFVPVGGESIAIDEAEVHSRFWLQPGPSIPVELRQRAQHRERFLSGYPIAWIEDPQTCVLSPFWIPREWCRVLLRLEPGERPPPLEKHVAAGLVQAAILIKPDQFQLQQQVLRNTLTQARRHFETAGYVNLSGLFHPLQIAAFAAYYCEVVKNMQLTGDPQCRLRFGLHNESLARFVHLVLTKVIEIFTGKAVTPSYSYFAGYRSGAALERHTDREQCEITLGLLLRYEPSQSGRSLWPLYLDTPKGECAIYQNVGDAIVFRGRVLPHWRNALPFGHSSDSLLLHYVFRDFTGPLQ